MVSLQLRVESELTADISMLFSGIIFYFFTLFMFHSLISSDDEIGLASQQGCTAAKSKVEYYEHNDMEDLEDKLKRYKVDEVISITFITAFFLNRNIFIFRNVSTANL